MARQRITEIKLIEELERSRDALADPNSDDPLVRWLRSRYPDRCRPAFVLKRIPGQGIDVFQILSADEMIVTVEISRRSGLATEITCNEMTHDLYHIRRRKPGRPERRKLEMALKLLREDGAV